MSNAPWYFFATVFKQGRSLRFYITGSFFSSYRRWLKSGPLFICLLGVNRSPCVLGLFKKAFIYSFMTCKVPTKAVSKTYIASQSIHLQERRYFVSWVTLALLNKVSHTRKVLLLVEVHTVQHQTLDTTVHTSVFIVIPACMWSGNSIAVHIRLFLRVLDHTPLFQIIEREI